MNESQPNTLERWWDIPSAVILFFAVYIAAHRLNATEWTDELSIIITISIFGLIAGLALGQSNFGHIRARRFAAVYGTFIISWQLGNTFGKGVLWSEIISSLVRRLLIAFESLIRQRAVTDPILFLFLIAVMYWGMSVYAGYSLTRTANPWRATLPLGLALFIVHIHDPYFVSRSWLLAVYIFLALLLLSRTSFLHKQAQWRKNHTHMPPYVGLDLLRVTIFTGALLILLSWTAPAMAANVPSAREAWQMVAQPWYEARAKMTNAFASLQASVGIVQDYYGDVQPLGRGNNLTDQVIMTVQAPVRVSGGVRYYWVGRTYDFFDGSSWKTSSQDTVTLTPDTFNPITTEYKGRWEAEFTFISSTPMNTVYTPPHLSWFSRPVEAQLIVNSDKSVDLLSIQASPNIRPGDIYDARALVTNTTESQLRSAGTGYPEWISERYLQLPESVTPRTRELAQAIAEGHDNPYDIAEAITQYLRENINYVDSIDTPPPNQDILDWILFDSQKGFCNYYASAEVILLRSLGIPARIAFGYAQGEREIGNNSDGTTNLYVVRQKDAHAWPEVYFPGVGWVEFEPTVNQSPLRRPVGDPEEETGVSSSIFNPDSSPGSRIDLEEALGFEPLENQPVLDEEDLLPKTNPWVPIVWLMIPGLVLITGLVISFRRNKLVNAGVTVVPVAVQIEKSLKSFGLRPPRFLRQWSTWSGLPTAARAYLQINKTLGSLGFPPAANQTPAERANKLIELLPISKGEIITLLKEYQLSTYAASGNGSDNPEICVQAAREIRKQGWLARFRQFVARFQEPAKRRSLV